MTRTALQRAAIAGVLGFGIGTSVTAEASLKVPRGNYERIFDEGRRRVRAWEAANAKGGL
jgi:hypothetical protein